ncbi:Uncharacterised protein [Streptococcus pneumoniae]|nr:Uncharacterised protein [Streptococcus pneumoniae]
MSKLLKIHTVLKTTRSPTTTLICGKTINLNTCQLEAPSILAASNCSSGTVCKAESTLTIIIGAPNQMLINTKHRNAHVLSVKNAGVCSIKPNFTIRLGK